MKTKTKTYRTIEKRRKEKKKEREETWTLLNTAYEKKRKKERIDIFSKIDSTSLHRLKKRRKENWTFLNCDCNIVLTCKVKKKIFEFEFKGDIRKFFFSCSYYEIWRKPFTEDFILGLMIFEIILILKFFFRIWGFRGIGNIFFLVSVFEEIVGWRENRTDIHPIGFRLLMGRRQRKQFYRRIRRPMKLFYFLVWSSENGIKEKRRGLLQNFVDNV